MPSALFGQVVLVLQGGGALGAYQLGVYQAMHEAGAEPDWVVGTSIGAINGSIIAGNPPSRRLEQLHAFWDRMEMKQNTPLSAMAGWFGNGITNLGTFIGGIPGFFAPNPSALLGQNAPLGIEKAAYYTTEPLRETLNALIDFDYLQGKATRLTVGAVNAISGEMRYFDSREDDIRVEHIMASGALPPAFPAVRIDGVPYWDGGIYSNTPVEVVLDDNPRRDSTIFAVQLWNAADSEPKTLADINERTKDIQFSTRDNSHIQRQQQIHKLRHIIREMGKIMPADLRERPEMRELAAWGCGTTMHLVRLHAPRIRGEDAAKDIDFTSHGIRTRWQAGYDDARRAFEIAPWTSPTESTEGVVIHQIS
jgi:NTE family protein